MKGFHCFQVAEPGFAPVDLAVVSPPYTVLGSLEGTPWYDLVRPVSGEALGQARYGHLQPLLKEIGPAPRHLVRKIPVAMGRCGLSQSCAGFTKDCVPGPKVPDCYSADTKDTVQQEVINALVLFWKEGRYVVRAVGEEFILG